MVKNRSNGGGALMNQDVYLFLNFVKNKDINYVNVMFDSIWNSPDLESTSHKLRKIAGRPAPVHIAAKRGHDKVVKTLLAHGFDGNTGVYPNTWDKLAYPRSGPSITPIEVAYIGGHANTIRVLLDWKDIQIPNTRRLNHLRKKHQTVFGMDSGVDEMLE
jgi:hypothetical protein